MLNYQIRSIIVLSGGLIAVSAAAIFIRLAQTEAVPSLVISAGRLLIASWVLSVPALGYYRSELRNLTWREIGLGVWSGVFLALHFAAWITSLEYTSVTASVVLVATNPLFVALLSLPFLDEKANQKMLLGIGLAFAGSVLVALSDDAGAPPTRSAPLLGSGLALLGALAIAVYLIIGRKLRGKLSLIPYIWLVYGSAAVVLLLTLLARGERLTGYSPAGYLWIIALGLIPQLIGHSSFNYALGHLPAAHVSLVAMGEPIGSALLAIIILQEFPAGLTVIGSGIILIGIITATYTGKSTGSSAGGDEKTTA